MACRFVGWVGRRREFVGWEIYFFARIVCLRAFYLCPMLGVDLDGRGAFCVWSGRLRVLLMRIGAFGRFSAGRKIYQHWPGWEWVLLRRFCGYD